ncbi:DUF3179 domain-containing protein [Leucothrix sargassi]|nr:DUF3179 domain-containing protein [Leucothrix sargassi]
MKLASHFTKPVFISLVAISSLLSGPTAFANDAHSKNLHSNLTAILNTSDPATLQNAINTLSRTWRVENIPQVLEALTYAQSNYTSQKLVELLQAKTGQSFGRDTNQWYFWLWNRPEHISKGYANFKADLYRNIDQRFDRYFRDRQHLARIRLDEVRWGGVEQDGIPPLRYPKMISAQQANYLDGDNIVFGVEINGDARAYPKRILAWHEMFVDTIGGEEITGVYCTLCGTVIPYKTTFKGKKYNLGTSGFLYRSNKLMYDKETQSLWNTIKGEPVIGPLVDKGIALEHLRVVTTTWQEWKRRHPNTTVLSPDTGHRRDYGEGAAYRQYFSTQQLMFNTPFSDNRLQNKQEILALRFPAAPKEQLAIDTNFLKRNPLYKNKIGFQKLVVLTDRSGANRVYDPKNVNFVKYDGNSTVTDSTGGEWTLSESNLTSKSNGQRLKALPYHRAFWFGWHATYPETRLIK